MMDQFETDFADALARRAAEIPTAASSARLRSIDYHPRSPRLRPALTVGGAAGCAAAAAAVVSIVGLGAGTQPAFAGWSATPTAAAAGQTEAAEAACLARLPDSADAERDAERAREDNTAHAPATEALSKIAPSEWRTVLTDTRGPFTMLTLEAGEGKAEASCLSGPSASPALISADTLGGRPPATPPAGQVRLTSFGSESALVAGGQPFRQAEGRIGAGVTAVTIVLEDGTHVSTTIANGRFLAWWPGSQAAVSDEVSTASGTSGNPLKHLPVDAAEGHQGEPGSNEVREFK